MKIKLLVILLLTLSSRAFSQSLYYPSTTWQTTDPSSLGWCTSEIDSLYAFLQKGDSKAFVLLKDGKIVLEKYFGTFTQDSLWYWASAGKTLTAFAVGLAQQKGFLKLSDTSSKYLGKGWSSLTAEQEAKITVWHHLTMTTGLDDATGNADCTDKNCLVYKAEPGTRWAYHNAPYTLLDQIMQGAAGQNINAFLNANVKPTTGMTGLFVKTGYNNVYFSNARSMARYGLLLLGEGQWNGSAVMTDTGYLRRMRNSSQTLNRSYGYLTWLNGKSSFMIPQSQIVFPGTLMPNAPSDMYAALGKNSQYINVVPSQGLVLVRMGNDPPEGGGLVPTAFNNNIWKYLNKIMCQNNSTSGISDNNYTVYPNPSQGFIHISGALTATDKIHIMSSNGLVVAEFTGVNDLDIRNLSSGIYTLHITHNSGNYVQKIVLE
jgi:CubicO group peptidase (beta-lactamase class C family)